MVYNKTIYIKRLTSVLNWFNILTLVQKFLIRILMLINTRKSAQFLGVNISSFCAQIVPVISHLRVSGFHENEWFYKEEDLIKIKPFLEQYGCGRIAARAIKKFLEEESK